MKIVYKQLLLTEVVRKKKYLYTVWTWTHQRISYLSTWQEDNSLLYINSFAMTINKSQRQSMSIVGLYLPSPVFSHGQLYVALSHVKMIGGLKIMILDEEKRSTSKTLNVIYREVSQYLKSHWFYIICFHE